MVYGFYKMDCVEGMKQFDDNYFDLAIVDPPYANPNEDENFDRFNRHGKGHFDKPQYTRPTEKEWNRFGGTFDKYKTKNHIDWDVAPPKEYWDELFRVSKHQIIWGGELL